MSETRRNPDGLAGREAPETLERKLVAAFRDQRVWRQAQRRRLWRGLAAVAALAAALAVISFLRLRQPAPAGEPPPVTVAKGVLRGPDPDTVPPPVAPPARRKTHRKLPAIAPETTAPARQQEVVTGYMALDASGTMPASGEVIRMEVPRSTLAMFGLPVNEQRLSVPVRADVLFGEDGRARALRFVTTTSFETPRGR